MLFVRELLPYNQDGFESHPTTPGSFERKFVPQISLCSNFKRQDCEPLPLNQGNREATWTPELCDSLVTTFANAVLEILSLAVQTLFSCVTRQKKENDEQNETRNTQWKNTWKYTMWHSCLFHIYTIKIILIPIIGLKISAVSCLWSTVTHRPNFSFYSKLLQKYQPSQWT